MPRAPLSADAIEAFRERAVSAATRLFGERGYDAVTMRAVAKALGVSPMTPYRYFEDKEELFAQVRAAAFRQFAKAQAAAAEGSGGVRAKLARLQRAYLDYGLAHPEAYRIMFELSQAPAGFYPELDRAGSEAFSYLHRTVTEAVEEGVLEGEPLSLAQVLWAQTHGLLTLHLAAKLPPGTSLEALAKTAFDHTVPTERKKR